jgi:hypothetical protein
MNSYGPRIGLTTSPGMVLRLKKSNRCALVVRSSSEQSPKARIQCTMSSDKQMRDDIC